MKRNPLRARPAVDHHDEPGYTALHTPQFGAGASCGASGLLLRQVVLEAIAFAIDLYGEYQAAA